MIDLWYVVDTDVPPEGSLLDAYRALLTDDERARMNRYVFDRDRRGYSLERYRR